MKHESEHFKGVPSSYRELVEMHPPRQIRTEAECDAASKIIEKMIGHKLSADQEDYMDLLATLVSAYDEQHHPVTAKKMSPLEALMYLMDESGMNASDLGRLFGNRELGSKILRGERGLSMANITALASRFSVGPELFMPFQRPKGSKGAKKAGTWRGARTEVPSRSRKP